MDDACSVGHRERVGNLNPDLQRLLEGQRAFLEPLLQRLAFQVLHHQEADPILAANIEDRTDVWMTEGCECSGLALEPRLQITVGSDVLGKDLDGNRAVEARVERLVDLAL